jgi:hypothetical protein
MFSLSFFLKLTNHPSIIKKCEKKLQDFTVVLLVSHFCTRAIRLSRLKTGLD